MRASDSTQHRQWGTWYPVTQTDDKKALLMVSKSPSGSRAMIWPCCQKATRFSRHRYRGPGKVVRWWIANCPSCGTPWLGEVRSLLLRLHLSQQDRQRLRLRLPPLELRWHLLPEGIDARWMYQPLKFDLEMHHYGVCPSGRHEGKGFTSVLPTRRRRRTLLRAEGELTPEADTAAAAEEAENAYWRAQYAKDGVAAIAWDGEAGE